MAASSDLHLAVDVVTGRWFMVYATFLIMSAAGATYIFAVYSKDIKSTLGYDQQTLNTISFFKDLGANVGIISGIVGEIAPPWVVLAVGSAMNFSGYFLIYLALTGRTAKPHLWQMCLYICVGANSQTFANTGALVSAVKNFPKSRGIVLGLLKGYVGLSGAIFTQLYLAFYGHDSKSLVLLIAWLPAAASVVFLRTIRVIKGVGSSQESEFKVFCSFLYISLILAGYLMIAIIIQKRVSFSHAASIVSAAVILVLLFLPICIVIREEIKIFKQKQQTSENDDPGPISVAIVEEKSSNSSSDERSNKTFELSSIANFIKPPRRGEDYSILQALLSIDMAIVFFATICGVGGTLTAIDNMGQIGESMGYSSLSVATFVSLISIWNYMGRVAAGFASELVLAKYKLPRPVLFALVMALSCVGHLLIAFSVPGSLYIASVVVGFTFGAQMPLLLAIISEVFGLKYFATLYNFGGLASPVGSYLLNVRVAGYLYDKEAARQNAGKIGVSATAPSKEVKCIGTQCFRLAFLIITGVTVAGVLALLVLGWRTKEFYRGDIYAKFRDDCAEEGGGEAMRKEESREEEEEIKAKDSVPIE